MRKKTIKNKLGSIAVKTARKNFGKLYEALLNAYPDAHCALDHRNPWELLVATVLSAQCTDKRVNMVTPELFKKYGDAKKMAKADLADIERLVRSTGFYRNKAKNIKAASEMIVKKFSGKVPDRMEDLLLLPGVARKTANVVLWNAYGKNDGVVVDTHVGRVSRRLGLATQDDPGKVEKELMKVIPRENWGHFSHLLIDLGRDVCKAPTPICGRCKLKKLCPWYSANAVSLNSNK